MKRTGRCPKCNSSELIADARAVDRGHYEQHRDMIVARLQDPGRAGAKGVFESTVSAWVCLQCGFVELYADYPAKLIG